MGNGRQWGEAERKTRKGYTLTLWVTVVAARRYGGATDRLAVAPAGPTEREYSLFEFYSLIYDFELDS